MSVARGDLRREREVVRRRWRQREREREEKRRGCGGSRRGATELHSLWLWLCFSGGEAGTELQKEAEAVASGTVNGEYINSFSNFLTHQYINPNDKI